MFKGDRQKKCESPRGERRGDEDGKKGAYKIRHTRITRLIEFNPFFDGAMAEDVREGFGDGYFAGGAEAGGAWC